MSYTKGPDAHELEMCRYQEMEEAMMPRIGDRYMWHTGYTVTVIQVDGAMTIVSTDAGNRTSIPTGTLMHHDKMKAQS